MRISQSSDRCKIFLGLDGNRGESFNVLSHLHCCLSCSQSSPTDVQIPPQSANFHSCSCPIPTELFKSLWFYAFIKHKLPNWITFRMLNKTCHNFAPLDYGLAAHRRPRLHAPHVHPPETVSHTAGPNKFPHRRIIRYGFQKNITNAEVGLMGMQLLFRKTAGLAVWSNPAPVGWQYDILLVPPDYRSSQSQSRYSGGQKVMVITTSVAFPWAFTAPMQNNNWSPSSLQLLTDCWGKWNCSIH